MTAALTSFFDNSPVNHWSSIVVIVLSILCIIYSLYFFFSKEGKDERGKAIISTASFTAFIVAVVLLFVLGSSGLHDLTTHNSFAYYWILNFVLLIVSGTEALGILILRKIK